MVFPSLSECEEALRIFQATCTKLGVPLAMEKTEVSDVVLEFPGIIADIRNMLMKLLECKLVALKYDLKHWQGQKIASVVVIN